MKTKIYGYDFSWADGSYPHALMSGAAAASGISGIAWHRHCGNPAVMSAEHYLRPRLEQLETECSPGLASVPMPSW